jgi:DNA-binding LytR/AlgR family response regulator
MTGCDLAVAARIKRPGLAILYITGYAQSAAPGFGAAELGMLVLAKPFSMDALASHILELAPC